MRGRAEPASILVVVVFALLYAPALFAAISNLVALPAVYQALGIPDAVPWWLLVLGVLIPPAAFAIALRLGRGRSAAQRGVLLLVGLAATHALSLSAVALVAALLRR